MEKVYYANLAFLCSFTDGKKDNEVLHELSKIVLQIKGTIPYNRGAGAGLQEIEQEFDIETARMLFVANLIEEVYKLNERRGFNPFIVIGYEDINIRQSQGALIIHVQYRFLEDMYTNKEAQIYM